MNTKIYSTKITVLIVLFNENIDLIFKTLNKLKSFKIIIVDNAGSYQNKKKIEENFSIEKYIINKKNVGFSAGYNQALKLSLTEYSLILNPDCVIDEKNIFKLIEAYIKYNDCLLVVPTSYDENKNLTYSGGLLPENGDKNVILNLTGDTCVESALGACMLVKTNAIKDFGLFDQNFFLYFSDDDLCGRIRKLNKSIIQVYDAICLHKHGNIKVTNKFYKIFIREYNFTHDRLYYFFKNNKHQELINFYKKRRFLYFFKIVFKLISFNLTEATRLASILSGYYRFYLKFYLNRKDK